MIKKKMKTFYDYKKIKKFMTTKSALQEMVQ
jgi:hypothetical protein